ncbi:MAG: PCP reductase family protein [Candidatus Rokubacteria bacterium]|nr:PCP reductase family protein [Candidatus Rokubacteria bacterium]
MKFLCVECDEPMQLVTSQGPDEGSLTVTFGCPRCSRRVAMLTNPLETQLIRSLGVKVGGRTVPAAPFEHLRSSLARQRVEAFEETLETPPANPTAGAGCPFAGMIVDQEATAQRATAWSAEAEARVERIPSFIRPMAKKAIERYAESKGYRTITETVMDEARAALGM